MGIALNYDIVGSPTHVICLGPDLSVIRTASSRNWGLVMQTDTAWAMFTAIYPTIIVITVLLVAASLL
jgi:hypothetical protein